MRYRSPQDRRQARELTRLEAECEDLRDYTAEAALLQESIRQKDRRIAALKAELAATRAELQGYVSFPRFAWWNPRTWINPLR